MIGESASSLQENGELADELLPSLRSEETFGGIDVIHFGKGKENWVSLPIV
jgi:hypothetical protein